MITQFEMIIGEFPWNEQAKPLELFYTVAFASVIFVIMVNTFLLAVVVQAYDAVASAIKESSVEQNVVVDVLQSFGYVYFTLRRKWPSRNDVAEALAAIDVDG